MSDSQIIPEEAMTAAANAAKEFFDGKPPRGMRAAIRLALEAAAPHMLSHEREQTRLAHLDAVVNAGAVDGLEAKLDRVNAALFDLTYKWRNGSQVYYSDLEFIRKSLGDE